MIVEDERKLAKTLKTVLEGEHFSVDVAYDGDEGYEMATVEEYDVMILDIGLPSKNGLEVCRLIRDEGVETPILMLTARDATEDKIAGLDTGADDYLVKPFAVDELLARVRALIRRAKKQIGETVEVGSLTLNPKSHQVRRGGEVIELSSKEYAVLEYLMQHAGQIVPKQSLLEHVWGSEVDPFSKVVDVYVGYVRKKIDKNFPDHKALLKTVRGRGYKLG